MTVFTVGYAALLLACAVTDLLWLRIPNLLVLALVLLFGVMCLVAPPVGLLWNHLVPAVVAFVLAAGLFFWGKMGGGDVKMLAATMLWVGAPALPPFLIALAIYGAMAIVIFGVFRTQCADILAWASVQVGRDITVPASLKTGKSIPYGVVIAAAALSIGPVVTP